MKEASFLGCFCTKSLFLYGKSCDSEPVTRLNERILPAFFYKNTYLCKRENELSVNN